MLQHPALPRLLAQTRELGWLVQVQCEGDQLAAAAPQLRAARVPLLFDHCGRPSADGGIDAPGFRALLELGSEGHAVKLSGPFRFAAAPPIYFSAEPFVAALLDAFTADRSVWASDWPFLRVPARIDYGPVRCAPLELLDSRRGRPAARPLGHPARLSRLPLGAALSASPGRPARQAHTRSRYVNLSRGVASC